MNTTTIVTTGLTPIHHQTKKFLATFDKIFMYWVINNNSPKYCYKVKLVRGNTVMAFELSHDSGFECATWTKERFVFNNKFSPNHDVFDRYDPQALSFLLQHKPSNRLPQIEEFLISLLTPVTK